jgi:prevent-host-death family protein
MITVNTHEAKSQLSALLAAVEGKGERVVICRNGKPVAELVQAQNKARETDWLKPDPALKPLFIRYDPIEPLTNDDWPSENR